MIEFNEKVEIFFLAFFWVFNHIYVFFWKISFFSKSKHFREVPWLVLEMSNPGPQKKILSSMLRTFGAKGTLIRFIFIL